MMNSNESEELNRLIFFFDVMSTQEKIAKVAAVVQQQNTDLLKAKAFVDPTQVPNHCYADKMPSYGLLLLLNFVCCWKIHMLLCKNQGRYIRTQYVNFSRYFQLGLELNAQQTAEKDSFAECHSVLPLSNLELSAVKNGLYCCTVCTSPHTPHSE